MPEEGERRLSLRLRSIEPNSKESGWSMPSNLVDLPLSASGYAVGALIPDSGLAKMVVQKTHGGRE